MRKKKNFAPRWERVTDWLAPDPPAHRGAWRTLCPGADALHVELGCGKGSFLAATARENPDTQFVGLERAPEALLMAMEKAKADNLGNVRFIDGDAALLDSFFTPGEADALYINFCDPWPPRKRAKRRLTHRDFLASYRKLLKPGCPLRLKTDNVALFDFSLEELAASGASVTFRSTDWHRDPSFPGDDHMTEYEARFSAKGVPICRLVATW